MDAFFDLDQLHKKQNKQRRIKLTVGGLSLAVAVVTGVALLSSKTQHLANTGYSTSASSASIGASSSAATRLSTTNTSNLSQEEAQEKALAAQDEADAQKDIAAAENSQSALNSEVPPASANPSSSSAGITGPNPSLCPGIEAQEQSALAPYSAQAKQLNAEIQSLDTTLSLENPQTAATLQTISNELNTVDAQISSINAQYASQLGANECS